MEVDWGGSDRKKRMGSWLTQSPWEGSASAPRKARDRGVVLLGLQEDALLGDAADLEPRGLGAGASGDPPPGDDSTGNDSCLKKKGWGARNPVVSPHSHYRHFPCEPLVKKMS